MSTGRPWKPLVWLGVEIRTPPLSPKARKTAGGRLRLIQGGRSIGLPRSRPMPTIGARVHELRIEDENRTWRVVYRIDDDAVVIADVFDKTTPQTPQSVIDRCKARLAAYDAR